MADPLGLATREREVYRWGPINPIRHHVMSTAKIKNRLEKLEASENGIPEQSHAVTLVDLNVRTIRVTVRGTSPLITHAWSEKAIRMMEDVQQKKAKKGKEAKDPAQEMDGALYKNEKGQYCVPARAFKCAMVSAATSIDDKKFPKTKIRQALFVQGDLLPIVSEYEPNMRRDMVRLNGTTADIRYRPEWTEWQVVLDIQFNQSVISDDQVVNLIKLAGFAVGVGEWRPERNGNNGRFEVVTSNTRG